MAEQGRNVDFVSGSRRADAMAEPRRIVDLASVKKRLTRTGIRGSIAGERYSAAWTCGDGACGLHSVMGTPRSDGSALFCPNARAVVFAGVPESAQEVIASFGGALREAFLELTEQFWKDFALPAARALAEGQSLRGLAAECKSFWKVLPSELQEELQGFARFQRYELRQREEQKQLLLNHARRHFSEDREEHVIRPLCVLLGYLNSGRQIISDAGRMRWTRRR